MFSSLHSAQSLSAGRGRRRFLSPAAAGRSGADGSSPSVAPDALARTFPWALAAFATALYGPLSSLQWNSVYFPSWDLGIFSALIQQYANFDAPIVWIKGDHYNLLGDHFHPLLVVLAPLWWVWPSPLALLWAQAALLSVSAVPLTRYAMQRFGAGIGIAIGVSYLFSFGIQGTHNVQFHEYALAVPLLAFGVTALLEKRVRAALLWLAPLVWVKEDLGLTVMMLGLAGAWMLRDRGVDQLLPEREKFDPPSFSRAWARAIPGALHPHMLALACWGLAWFVLATFVFLPLLSPTNGYEYTDNFAPLVGLLGPLTKWQTLAMFAAFMGLVGLRSPLAIALLPTLAWRFMGSVEFYWTWEWHYNSILMPIACGALLHALPDLKSPRRRTKEWAAVSLSLLSTAHLLGALPLVHLADGSFDPSSPYAKSAQAAVSAVPEGVTVASDVTLLAHLVPGRSVQWLHGETTRAPQCVTSRIGENERTWAPHGLAAWANQKWKTAVTPGVYEVNGGEVQTTSNAPYGIVYADAYFQVVCQKAR